MVRNVLCLWAATGALLVANQSVSRADILAGSFFDSRILRLDDETGAELPGGISAGSAGLAFPAGVAVGPDGNIYVSSNLTGEILFYNGATGAPLPSPHVGERDGLFATLPDNPPAEEGGDPLTAAPARLRFGPDGDLYVSDFGSPVVREFDGVTGDFLSDAATVSFVSAGIEFASNGDLLVGDFGAAMVMRFGGGGPQVWVPPGSAGLQTPGGLLTGYDDELLVSDLYGNQILRFDSSGQNGSQWAEIPPENMPPLPPGADPSGSNFPSDMAWGPDGNLMLAVLGLTNPLMGGANDRGAVLRFDPSGILQEDDSFTGLTPISSVAWIAAAGAIAGDYDGNGSVQEGDFDKWRLDFGKLVAPGSGADGNGNGIVDAADYTYWRDILSALGSGAGAGAAAVPEPSASVLWAWSALWLCNRRRRR
jgi:hypothetical protein